MNYNMDAPVVPQDADGVVVELGSLYGRLCAIWDWRRRQGRRYEMAVLLVAMVLAKLSGADTPQEIAEWVAWRAGWFTTVFQLKRLFRPHAATFRRVARHAETVTALEQVEREFLLSAPGAGQSEQIALDGKTMRSVKLAESGRALSLLAVFLPAEGLVLRQVAVADKSNEIPAAPEALKQVDLRGKIVTADALHTQRELSEVVVAGQGHYVWTAKDNQLRLCRDIQQLFAPERCLPGTSRVINDLRVAEVSNKGHGRLETRRLTTSSLLAESSDWPHLAQVFKLERTFRYLKTGDVQTETVYGLTSLPAALASPQRLLHLVRAHWGIENKLHWRRDAVLREDATRTQSPLLGQAIACLNNLVIGLITRLGWRNLARARRFFAAHPEAALRTVLTPLA
jgi:predicted transposase YbfD/YdcC